MSSTEKIPLSFLVKTNKMKRGREAYLWVMDILRFDFDVRQMTDSHRRELQYLLEQILLES